MKTKSLIVSAAVSLVFFASFAMPAAADGPNLVINPSVETVSPNPAMPFAWLKGGFGTNTRTLTYPVPGHLGANAMKTEITTYADGDAKWYFQPVAVTPGKSYVISDWYLSNVTSVFKVQFQLQDGSFKYPTLNTLPASSAWTQARQTFTVPMNYASPVVNVTVFHSISAVGWLTTDDYSLQLLDMVDNPSVETGATDPTFPLSWLKGGYGDNVRSLTYPVLGHLGARAVKTRITSYVSGDAKWYFRPLAVTGGRTYVLSDWYTSNIPSIVKLQYQLEDGTFRYPNIKTLPVASAWTQSKQVITVPTDYGSPVVSVTSFHSISQVGWVTTDDYALQLLDTQSPSISLNAVSPQPARGTISLTATVADNVGVNEVRFFVDGDQIGDPVTTAPFTLSWNTYAEDDGTHEVYAIARDGAANSKTSNVIQAATRNHTHANLTVKAVVINDNGGAEVVDDFPLYIDATNVQSGAANLLESGSYVVSATFDPSYTAKISGACDTAGNVTIDLAATTCTITFNDVQPAPPLPSANAILNPSMETASWVPSLPLHWKKGGSGSNTRVLSYPVTGFDGAKAVKTSISSYVSGDAKWYFDPVAVTTGQQLTYSDFYKGNTTSYLSARYTLQDGSYDYPDFHIALPSSTTWKQVSHTFLVPASSSPAVSMTIFHAIDSNGWIAIDAAVLTAFVPPPADPANLISNGTLESISAASANQPASWGTTNSDGSTAVFRYPVPGRTSARAAWINVTDYTDGAGAKWFFDPVTIVPKADYEFIDWYKATAETNIEAQILLSDGTYDYLVLKRPAPASVWTMARVIFNAPANAVNVTMLHSLQATGTLTTDDYSLKKLPSGKFSAGMISFDIDDGLISGYDNAIPRMNAAGIKSSQYILPHMFGDPNYIDQTEAGAIQAAHHEIGAHTRSHSRLTSLSQSAMVSEVSGSKSDLAAIGMVPVTFAYPFGDFNDAVQQAVADAGFRGARSVLEGFNDKYTDQYALLDQHMESDVTIAQVRSWIDQAKADKTWLILEMHGVDDSGDQFTISPAMLDQVIAYVKSSGISVVTNSQGLTAMGH